MKGCTILAKELPEALSDGIGFDGSSITGFVSIEESYRVMKPDANTLRSKTNYGRNKKENLYDLQTR
jgi:glutamine synthetase